MEEYIENVVKAGLQNGLTLEYIITHPDECAEMYLQKQLKSCDDFEKQFIQDNNL